MLTNNDLYQLECKYCQRWLVPYKREPQQPHGAWCYFKCACGRHFKEFVSKKGN